MAEGSNYDYLFKVSDRHGYVNPYRNYLPHATADSPQVVLIGDSGVGKS